MYEAQLYRKDGVVKNVHAWSMKGLKPRIDKEKSELKNYVIKNIRIDQMKQGRGYEYVE